MILTKPSVHHVDVTTDPMKAIELAGRTCYKSKGKITEGSADKFVKMLLDRGHHAMIEHSNVILSVGIELYDLFRTITDRRFINMTLDIKGNGPLISGNLTAWMEICIRPEISAVIQKAIAIELCKKAPIIFQPMLDDHLGNITDVWVSSVELFKDVEKLSRTEKLYHQVASYRIVCDRGVTHEIVRHRPVSYAQESTRYCNYKGGVTFIIPPWVSIPESLQNKEVELKEGRIYIAPWDKVKEGCGFPDAVEHWLMQMVAAELGYKALSTWNWKPQQARSVLPNSLKTEIVMTCNLLEWRHFFKLRCAKTAHPQMQEVANMILRDICKRIPVIFDDYHDSCNLCKKLGEGCEGMGDLTGACKTFEVID